MKPRDEQTAEEGKPLGMVLDGSLTQGVTVKLDPEVSVEDLAVGRLVTIHGEHRRFFGQITDVRLGSADPHLALTPPDVSDPFIARVVSGTTTFGTLHVLPTLTLGSDASALLEGPQPAKTIPTHFSRVLTASARDVELVFGKEDQLHLWIGNPLDMETRVCLNLEDLVKRSNGVFGKSGTGKTFLTRLLLAGIVQKDVATNLIFDMHSEYGWEGPREGGLKVKGLKQLFPSRVVVFALDEESARRRGLAPDLAVRIGYHEVEPEDIEMLSETLNLTEKAAQAVYKLPRHLGGKDWLGKFLALESREEMDALADKMGESEQTVQSLKRRLERLKRLPFLVPQTGVDAVPRILEYLDRGVSVVLEFGRYGSDLAAYILVANLITRRLHETYVRRTEEAMGEKAAQPHTLVITIEEAHKFLSPTVAAQTIFGTIAREMRKYSVTLLVVDQRPSGIDEEVMSQIGTRVTCLLDNERDIDSVLAGAPGKGELKAVLSRLESRQQALIFGHAVPMPIVVRTREYGSPQSYKDFGLMDAAAFKKEAQDLGDLWR